MIEAAMLHWLLVQLPRDDADVLTEWIVRTSGYDPHSVEALRLGDSGNVWLSTLFAHHGHAHWQGPFGVLPGAEAPDGLIVALVIGLEYGPPPWSDILEWVMARYQEHLASQPTHPPSFVPRRQRIPHPGKQPPSQVEPKALHVPHPRREKP
jgi:hypothetical protein